MDQHTPADLQCSHFSVLLIEALDFYGLWQLSQDVVNCALWFFKLGKFTMNQVLKAWLHLFQTTKYFAHYLCTWNYYTVLILGLSVWIHMASQLTTPTHHMVLFSTVSATVSTTVAGTYPAREMLKGNLWTWNFAWRLSTMSLARFYFGELRKLTLLPISQNKVVEYAWVRSSTEQKQTPAMVARTPWHHHRHFYTNYATLTILRQD